ncbi:MAG: phage major capsid protein, partial [Eubacteriales bacterium]|nr:phage major capsid protein [Eubacteriales bacterium]
MTITEMRNKRAKLWNTMEGFLDTHRNDMGVLSAEDDATYSKMEHDLDSLTNEIKRMERRDAIEAELSKPVNQPITEAPERAASIKPDKVGRASDAYKEDFDRHLRGKILVHNVLSEGTDADGGYLVPEDFERDIVTALEEENVIRSLAKVITTQHERKIPVATGHSTAQWTAENAAYT